MGLEAGASLGLEAAPPACPSLRRLLADIARRLEGEGKKPTLRGRA